MLVMSWNLLELAMAMLAATSVALTVEQLLVLLDELDLLDHGPRERCTSVHDPEPVVSLDGRGYDTPTVKVCAWIKRVVSPGI